MNLHLLQIYAIAKYDLYIPHHSDCFVYIPDGSSISAEEHKKGWACVRRHAVANLIKTRNSPWPKWQRSLLLPLPLLVSYLVWAGDMQTCKRKNGEENMLDLLEL